MYQILFRHSSNCNSIIWSTSLHPLVQGAARLVGGRGSSVGGRDWDTDSALGAPRNDSSGRRGRKVDRDASRREFPKRASSLQVYVRSRVVSESKIL